MSLSEESESASQTRKLVKQHLYKARMLNGLWYKLVAEDSRELLSSAPDNGETGFEKDPPCSQACKHACRLCSNDPNMLHFDDAQECPGGLRNFAVRYEYYKGRFCQLIYGGCEVSESQRSIVLPQNVADALQHDLRQLRLAQTDVKKQVLRIRESVTFVPRHRLWETIKNGVRRIVNCRDVQLLIVSPNRDAVSLVSKRNCERFNDSSDLQQIQNYLQDEVDPDHKAAISDSTIAGLEDGTLLVAIRHATRDPRLLGMLRVYPCEDSLIDKDAQLKLVEYAKNVGEGLYRRRLKKSDIRRRLKANSRSMRSVLRRVMTFGCRWLECDCAEVSFLHPTRPDTLQLLSSIRVQRRGERLVVSAEGRIPFEAPSRIGLAKRTLGESSHRSCVVVVRDLSADHDHQSLLKWVETEEASRIYTGQQLEKYREFLSQAKACVQLPMRMFETSECEGIISFYWCKEIPTDINLGQVFVTEQMLLREAAPRAWLYRRRELLANVHEDTEKPKAGNKDYFQFRDDVLKDLAAVVLEKATTYAGDLKLDAPNRAAVCVVQSLPTQDYSSEGKEGTPSCACLRIHSMAPGNAWQNIDRQSIPIRPPDSEDNSIIQSKIGHVALTRKSVWDNQRALSLIGRRSKFFKLDNECQALLAVPVQHGEQFYAVLDLEWKHNCEACENPGLRTYVERICDDYAKAIARFPIEMQLLTELTEVLNTNGQKGGEAKPLSRGELNAVATKFLRTLAKFLDCQRGSVFLREPGSCRYTLSAILREHEENWEDSWYEASQAGMGTTGWVLQSKKPLKINNLHDARELAQIDSQLKWTNRVTDAARGEQFAAFLAVPIVSNDEVVGVVRFIHPLEGHFVSNDVRLVLTAAQQFAGFLQAQSEIRRVEARRIVLEQAMDSQYLEHFAAKLFEAIAIGIGPCEAQLRVLDTLESAPGLLGPGEDKLEEHVLRRVNSTSNLKQLESPLFIKQGHGISGKVWHDYSPGRSSDLYLDDAQNQLKDYSVLHPGTFADVGSLLCLNLVDEEKRFEGTLLVAAKYARSFSKADRQFLSELAGLLSKVMNAVAERENDRLERKLLDNLTKGLMHFLNRHPRSTRREDLRDPLVRDLFLVLQVELLTVDSIGWVRILQKPSGELVPIAPKAIIEAYRIPSHSLARVRDLSQNESYAVLYPQQRAAFESNANQAADQQTKRAAALFGYDGKLLEQMKVSQLCYFVLRDKENVPFASFSLVVHESQAISRRRIIATDKFLTMCQHILQIASWFEAYAAIEPLGFATAQAALTDHDWMAFANKFVRKIEDTKTVDDLANLKTEIDAWHREVQKSRSAQQNYLDFLDQMKSIDLGEMLQEICSELRHELEVKAQGTLQAALASSEDRKKKRSGKSKIEVQWECANEDLGLRMKGDRKLLQQAIKRLLENSAAALERRPPPRVSPFVKVSLKSEDSTIKIEIEDNGPGIDPQEDKVRDDLIGYLAKKPRGGLAATYCMALIHSGTMTIKSANAEVRTRDDSHPGYTRITLTFHTHKL